MDIIRAVDRCDNHNNDLLDLDGLQVSKGRTLLNVFC